MTLYLDWDFRNLRVKTLGKSLLDINLIKWLSKCESSFHKGKDKRKDMARMDANSINSWQNREQYKEGNKDNEHRWKAKMKENRRRKLMEKESDDHATWWVITIKMSGRPPLESFILIKIRPRERRYHSLKLTQMYIVSLLHSIQHVKYKGEVSYL